MMRKEDFDYAMMLVSKAYNKEKLPRGWEGKEAEIMYGYETAKLSKGETNHHYPLLRIALELNFKKNIEAGFVEVIKQLFPKPARILDVGCGNGQYLRAIQDLHLCTGIDNKDVKVEGNYEFIRGSFPEVVGTELYDGIIMAEYLHLFTQEEMKVQIAHAKACLQPGGYLVVVENVYSKGLEYRLAKLGGGTMVKTKLFEKIYPLGTHWIGTIQKSKDTNAKL